MKSATPSDWKTVPLPDKRSTIDLDLQYSPEKLEQIKRGVIPEEMEDKWFVYWEDDTLFFHRSWTGFCLYIVRFAFEDDGATAFEADLNRNPEQYRNTDNDYDREMISFLIDVLLLRRQASFPSRQTSDSTRAVELFHIVGDAALGRHPGDDREPLFQIKSRCFLCAHKFHGHAGCMAFPVHLPHELATGDSMHDEEFPGDRGYRFEDKGDGSRELCPHLYRGKQVTIPLESVLKDAYDCDFNTEPSVSCTYQQFLKYFNGVDKITPHKFVIGATFTYSWMPTTLTLRHQDQFENVAAYFDAVRLRNDLDAKSLSLINSVVNNSMIGTSKLLHFVNPRRYAIYDRWVDTYIYGTPSDSRLYSVDHFMSYTCACRRAVEDERFDAVHQHVNKSLGYEVTALRALELIMFLTAKAQSRK